MNEASFLSDARKHIAGSYAHFEAFGGPCVYFHQQCLEAGREHFMSDRHVEMLYATLTAWGLHRMGDAKKTKAKLTTWPVFRDSLAKVREPLGRFVRHRMLEMSTAAYSQAILDLRPCYDALDLSVSNSTVVVNSKALFHLLPELIPPIDRQYTLRFFQHLPQRWLGQKGKFRQIQIPKDRADQFELFQNICAKIKELADQIDVSLFEQERRKGITPPKVVDNAIVSFVRGNSPRLLPI
jgi:hypothetical protein